VSPRRLDGRVDLVGKDLVLERQLNGPVETLEQLLQCLVGSTLQGSKNIVLVTGDGCAGDRPDRTNRDLPVAGNELLESR